jgi:hypothetical protein
MQITENGKQEVASLEFAQALAGSLAELHASGVPEELGTDLACRLIGWVLTGHCGAAESRILSIRRDHPGFNVDGTIADYKVSGMLLLASSRYFRRRSCHASRRPSSPSQPLLPYHRT